MRETPEIKSPTNKVAERPEVEVVSDEIKNLVGLSVEEIDSIDKDVEAKISQELDPAKKKMIMSLGRKFREAIFAYVRIVILTGLTLNVSSDNPHKKPETFDEMVQRAKIEMATKGITSEQAATYKPIMSNVLHRGVHPFGYKPHGADILKNLIEGRAISENAEGGREDAWRLYLGLPQRNDTFGISDYKPSKSKDDIYYYKINSFSEKLSKFNPETIKRLVDGAHRNKGKSIYEWDDWFVSVGFAEWIMKNYVISAGEDKNGSYISYWDRWDLDVPIERDGLIGKPFEIYDRIYYNPETFEVLGNN
ncbi:MAG: hypothetical protein WC705_00405 [Candidatus Paceibacterota bacterium]|jgi:hypothetical protein